MCVFIEADAPKLCAGEFLGPVWRAYFVSYREIKCFLDNLGDRSTPLPERSLKENE